MENLKKCLSLRQRLPLYTGEEIQNSFIFTSASDPGQAAIWTGKANTSRTLFPQCSLSLPDQEMMPKITQIIYDAFNRPVLSLQNASWADGALSQVGLLGVHQPAPHCCPPGPGQRSTNTTRVTNKKGKMWEQLLRLLGAKHQVESFLSPCNCFTAKF